MIQELFPDPPALRLSPDKDPCNIILSQPDKSQDLSFIFICIHIHLRLRDHCLYCIIISLPVLRRDKIMGFQIRIQPDLRDHVQICRLYFSYHIQTSFSSTAASLIFQHFSYRRNGKCRHSSLLARIEHFLTIPSPRLLLFLPGLRSMIFSEICDQRIYDKNAYDRCCSDYRHHRKRIKIIYNQCDINK